MPRPLGTRWALRQIPKAVLFLIVATALVSLAAAVGSRHGATALLDGLLVTPLVMHGELWRLVTWVFYELSPLSLVFACLALWWFGRDVATTFGRRRFLAFYFGLAVLTGAVTTLVGRLVWPEMGGLPYGGSWPMLCGLLVTWGSMFSERQLRFWGVPLTGRHLVALTLAGTALFAIFDGLAPFIPHFTAELAVLLWLRLRRRALVRRQDLQQRGARGEAWSFDEWYEKEKRRG
jgi:membrane associated rhomboid family serine protease